MIDTRTKIVPVEELGARLNGRPLVAAYIDPLASSHTARLRALAEIHGPLALCLCDPPDPLLPARARAELAAACRDVALVVIGEGALAHAPQIIDERPADLDRRAALIRHVVARQNG